jgi:hypothetical protein
MSTKITNALKVLAAVALLATAISSPSLAQSAPRHGDAGGYYHGYPLQDWYTQDGWYERCISRACNAWPRSLCLFSQGAGGRGLLVRSTCLDRRVRSPNGHN